MNNKNQKLNRERRLRRKANKLNLMINKGWQHWMFGSSYPVFRDYYGEKRTGYMIISMQTGLAVAGYDEILSHNMDLDDVEEYLKAQYERRELKW